MGPAVTDKPEHTHLRNTTAMRDSMRCSAKSRAGTPCRSPAVAGKKRCRMHGGAPGSGAPKGNQNALTTGLHTKEMREWRRELSAIARAARHTLSEIE